MSEEFVAEYQTAHKLARSRLVPREFRAHRLMRDLAQQWMGVADINPSAMATLRAVIVRLCNHVADQLGFDVDEHGLSDLRRRHLDSWETSLLAWQREKQTDTPYRYAVSMFAFLRYIEDMHPGTLASDVDQRVRQQTRISHIRGAPLQDYTEVELAAIKAAVRRLTQTDREWTQEPLQDVIIAFLVALLIATGEPVDVIRAITLDDIVASSTDPRSHGMDTEQISSARLADSYTVTLRKNRAHTVEDVTWNRKQHPVTVRYLESLIVLGASFRAQSGLSTLWVVQDAATGLLRRETWDHGSLRPWLARNVRETISEPQLHRRFRKSVIVADILADAGTYLRTQRRHTKDTFFDHYSSSPTLREHAGGLFVDSVTELLERAVGPTIDAGEGAVHLNLKSYETVPAASKQLPSSVGGALAGCQNPEASPHAPLGETCPMSRAGLCFTCPNAIVTAEHLPAVVLVNAVSSPDSAANLGTWQKVWGGIHTSTTVILQMFPTELVEDARHRTDEVLVDLGLRHDMRGADGY